jgi:hypothetical protein
MGTPTTLATITQPLIRTVTALLAALLLVLPIGCAGTDPDTAIETQEDELLPTAKIRTEVTVLPYDRARPGTYC